MARLEGKVALVTGAARGVGAAVGKRLRSEGAKVVLADILDEEGGTLAAQLGEGVLYVHLDVTDPGQWAEGRRPDH